MTKNRVVLTGFMGAGKSTVAKCLSVITGCEKVDLDKFIEETESRSIGEIIESDGIENFRRIETANLIKILDESEARIIALGGGAWTISENRELVKSRGCTSVWLVTTFEHCWRNISASKQARPLAKNRETVKKLFDERLKFYCLADWHFIIEPHFTLFETAKQIAKEIF